MARPPKLTAPRAALQAAIARGLLEPHGGQFAVKRGRRIRLYQRRDVERALADLAPAERAPQSHQGTP